MDSKGVPATPIGIQHLPDEILIEIFSYLAAEDLGWASYVCRKWRNVSKTHTSLWRKKDRAFCHRVYDIREVLVMVNAMPLLGTLHLYFKGMCQAEIVWPEMHLNIPNTWLPQHNVFVTENFVIDYDVGEDILSYLSWVSLGVLKSVHLRKLGSSRRIGMKIHRDNSPFRADLSPLCHLHSTVTLLTAQRACHKILDARLSFAPDSFSRDSLLESALAIAGAEVARGLLPLGGNGDSSQKDCALCPCLEEVSVFCEIDRINLDTLCRLGPLRVVRLVQCAVASLSFLPYCASSLEELVIGNCGSLEEFDFAKLVYLKRLRVLKLGNCPITWSAVCTYTEGLTHLESLVVSETHQICPRCLSIEREVCRKYPKTNFDRVSSSDCNINSKIVRQVSCVHSGKPRN